MVYPAVAVVRLVVGAHPVVVADEESIVVWVKMDYVAKWISWPKKHVNGPTAVASATSRTPTR